MENRSQALKLVSEAVHLDGNGFSEAAFIKYLQSLQVLAAYLNGLFISLGFKQMIEKVREMKHVLCMIHECSDRMAAIADKAGEPNSNSSNLFTSKVGNQPIENIPVKHINTNKLPGFEKLQNENMTLLKNYQWRFERAKDNYARTNLKLEFERRLTENHILAKKKFDLAVKQLQRERVNMMEKEMKKLFENQMLNEKEQEKKDLYASVLDYSKSETWPCEWKLNSWENSDNDVVKKVFLKTIRHVNHPLSQWIIMMQTNIKRDVDTSLRHYNQYCKVFLPEISPAIKRHMYTIKKVPDEYILNVNSEKINIPKHSIVSLEKLLTSTSSEIMLTINNVVHIFCLTYKSLLPEDSEEICLRLIESYILHPIWSNLITLYRIINIEVEYKIFEAMCILEDSQPSEFGFLNRRNFNSNVCEQSIELLKSLPSHNSLSQKLKILVEVSQTLCANKEKNQKNRIGADDFVPLLCYVIVKSKLPQLASECFAIEQLFDENFMFGEEGYALSSFLTALKYIEMKQLIDGKKDEKT